MKSIHFVTRIIISLIAIIGLNTLHSYAQSSYWIIRGAADGELVFNSFWYEIVSPSSPEMKYGTVYSSNHGQDITFYTDSIYYSLTGDKTPGLIYGSFNDYLVRSYDNGLTWDTTKFYHNKYFHEGSKPGELFATSSSAPNTLFISSDSGTTFSVCTGNLPFSGQKIATGPEAGQCYCMNNNYVISFTSDYWANYESYQVDTNITSGIPNQNPAFVTIMAGGDGELYLMIRKIVNDTLAYYIYRSLDYGQTFNLQYIWNDYQPNMYSLTFVTGREPGSFYIIKTWHEYDFIHEIIMYIIEFYYSSDGGVTYNQYYHNLYNEYFVGETPLPSVPSISLSPNPATNAVWMKNLPDGEVVTAIEISNLSGQSVFNYNCNSTIIQGQSLQVNLPATLAAGCYVVKVMAGNRIIAREKLMIVNK